MIVIKRDNYEHFFLDYLDGALSKSEINQLMSFVNNNPDLKNELDELGFKKLVPDGYKFNKKATLKKELIIEDSQKSNFNELCIANIEGDLNQFQIAEFNKLIEVNAQLKKQATLFEKTIFIPDLTICYNKKSTLRKSTIVAKQKIGYQYFSIAASVILLIALSFFTPKSIHENKNYSNLKSSINKEKEVLALKENSIISSTKSVNASIPFINQAKSLSEKRKINNNIIEDYKNLENRESVQPLFVRPIIIETKKFNNDLLTFSKIQLNQQPSQLNNTREYQSIKDVLAHVFIKNVFKKDDNLSKINTYDFANIAITGMNRLTGTKMSLIKKYDSSGNVAELEFNSRLIAFSTTVNN
ncbi:MAG: hypothetical protein AB7S50_14160 [Bacteroidales bacterium]